MPLTAIAGGALFAERFGSGPPRVLALHGWGRRGADFARVLDGLDAVAVDLPGFGASPPPPEAMGAEGYAGLLDPVWELFEEPPVVVGHSFGGRVAVVRQARRSDGAGLVVVGSPLVRREGPRVKPPVPYRLARLASRAGLVSEERMDSLRSRYGSADYRAATGVMRDVLVTAVNESYERELEQLRVPVHLLWGSDDTEVPVAAARRAADIVRASGGDVELDVLPGVGHHVPVQDPAAVRRAVDAMVERVSG